MIEQQIVLRVRPGEAVRFPGRCVACGQPARERMTLRKRRGQMTRRLEAPLCAECARRLARRSGEEERLLRLSWPAAAIAGVVLVVLALLLPFEPWWLRLLAGVVLGLVAAVGVRWALARRAEAAELPERRAVREAAQIVDFTWRDMTLAFARRDMAEQVRALNPDYLAEEPVSGDDAETQNARPEELNQPAEEQPIEQT